MRSIPERTIFINNCYIQIINLNSGKFIHTHTHTKSHIRVTHTHICMLLL